MMRPEDVTPENVDEARAQMLSEMKGLATSARRMEEVLAAVYNRTANPEVRARLDELHNTIAALDAEVAKTLEDWSNNV